jgi:hypothetical protein
MARHFTVTLTSGTNNGPYTIYHTSSTNGNQALLYGTSNQAINLTLAQVQGGVLVTVPDNATSVIFYNNNATIISDCPTNIVEYPLSPSGPTATPNATPNETPQPSATVPDSTPNATPNPTATVPDATPNATQMPTYTPTPIPSATPVATPNETPQPSATPNPSSTPTMYSYYVTLERTNAQDFCTTPYLATSEILSTSSSMSGMLSKYVYDATDGSPFTGSPGKFRFLSAVYGADSQSQGAPDYISIDGSGFVVDLGAISCNGGENPY